MISDIMHSFASIKANSLKGGVAKPPVYGLILGQRGYRIEQGQRVYNNANKRMRAIGP